MASAAAFQCSRVGWVQKPRVGFGSRPLHPAEGRGEWKMRLWCLKRQGITMLLCGKMEEGPASQRAGR